MTTRVCTNEPAMGRLADGVVDHDEISTRIFTPESTATYDADNVNRPSPLMAPETGPTSPRSEIRPLTTSSASPLCVICSANGKAVGPRFWQYRDEANTPVWSQVRIM
jgi:hypothetical protein